MTHFNSVNLLNFLITGTIDRSKINSERFQIKFEFSLYPLVFSNTFFKDDFECFVTPQQTGGNLKGRGCTGNPELNEFGVMV